MKVKDYYKILGVERSASSAEIKRAYHRLARIYHPDKNNGNDRFLEKFKDITEAYKVLGNLDNRLKYSIILNHEKKLLQEIKDFEKNMK